MTCCQSWSDRHNTRTRATASAIHHLSFDASTPYYNVMTLISLVVRHNITSRRGSSIILATICKTGDHYCLCTKLMFSISVYLFFNVIMRDLLGKGNTIITIRPDTQTNTAQFCSRPTGYILLKKKFHTFKHLEDCATLAAYSPILCVTLSVTGPLWLYSDEESLGHKNITNRQQLRINYALRKH